MKITKIVLVLLTLSLLFTGLVACDIMDNIQEAPETTGASGTTATPDSNTGYCDMNAVANEIDSMSVSSFTETTEKTEYVKFTVKDHGEFVVRLRADIAPITVENFQKLVSEKFYDGLTFHRVVKGFMIQGGDPKGDGTGGSGTTIKGEFSQNGVRNQLSHITGVISMARLSMPLDSATSQFFVCNADASRSLDGGYAAFGYVVAGMETVLMISDVEVTYSSSGEMSKPLRTVVIEKVCFVTN